MTIARNMNKTSHVSQRSARDHYNQSINCKSPTQFNVFKWKEAWTRPETTRPPLRSLPICLKCRAGTTTPLLSGPDKAISTTVLRTKWIRASIFGLISRQTCLKGTCGKIKILKASLRYRDLLSPEIRIREDSSHPGSLNYCDKTITGVLEMNKEDRIEWKVRYLPWSRLLEEWSARSILLQTLLIQRHLSRKMQRPSWLRLELCTVKHKIARALEKGQLMEGDPPSSHITRPLPGTAS
jgi:hypothetical protein